MKRLIIVIFFGWSSFLFSQNIFLNTGVNLTTYDYKNSSGGSSENGLSSNGMFYEWGYSIPLDFSKRSRGWGRYSRMQFKTSFTLNDYNATGGNSLDNYDWKSQYAGLRTGVEYMVFPRIFALSEVVWAENRPSFNDFKNKVTGMYPILDKMDINYSKHLERLEE